AEQLLSDSEEYDNYIAENKVELENVMAVQQSYLRDKLIAQYTEQLEEKEKLFEQMKSEGQKQLDDVKKQLEEANIQIMAYESQLNTLDSLVRSLQAAIEADADILESIYGLTVDFEGDINNILEILGQNGVYAGSGSMEYLYNEYRNAIAQYNSIRGQLNYAKSQYVEGLVEYQNAKDEFDTRIAEAEEELKSARHQLEDLPKSQWIMLDRDLIYTSIMYRNNTQQMESIGIYMPMMFFLVAALVCLTTMKRLVDEQRGQIGIYVALGYSDLQIIGKYVTYALLASLCGGISGAIVGQMLFPSVTYNTWRMAYYLPKISASFSIPNLLLSVGSFTVLMCGITAYVVNNITKDSPASLMRPVAPKKGKELFIEKITFLWNALSFTSKITARNIFRYKSRFLMTIAGIAGCAGLLIMAFGIKYSVSDVVYIQNRDIFTYDYSVTFEGSEYVEAALEKLNSNPHVDKAVEYGTYTTRVYLDGKEATASTIVIDPKESSYMFNLRETDKKTPIRLGNDGIIVSEKFAKNHNLKKGDTITIESGSRIKQDVTISNICEMYFQHYIFMTDSFYKDTFDEELSRNKITIQVEEDYDLYPEIKNFEGFANMTNTSDSIKKYGTLIDALNLIIVVIILVAGSLAFVVIVNLTQVNISERIREIATLKVLGFNDREVNMYIFKEILLLSMIGCVVGIPIGIVEHKFIMSVLNIEMIMYGNRIKPVSYLYSVIITIVFTVIVLMFMRKPLREVDMVESLKSVE
ncbi:MAG: FtsX-like permease family protein, partial [Erysipelotrichaceae bacterium]|nr:FtsX-like permease family protein [Erysipelotrichaceae bacterium]